MSTYTTYFKNCFYILSNYIESEVKKNKKNYQNGIVIRRRRRRKLELEFVRTLQPLTFVS